MSGLLAYYAGLAEDRCRPSGPGRGPGDYYLDPEEPPGRWWGHGQAAAGVSGDVTGEDLRTLLDGRHPVTGRPLGRRFGDSSARGFDATFSAPKSVSALWALSPDRFVRAEVLSSGRAARQEDVRGGSTSALLTGRVGDAAMSRARLVTGGSAE
ncbi:MAG: relaxase domain-containing protein [Iamia sp.]